MGNRYPKIDQNQINRDRRKEGLRSSEWELLEVLEVIPLKKSEFKKDEFCLGG